MDNELEQLISDEEALSDEIAGKVRELIEINNSIHKKCKFESNLRPVSTFAGAKLRTLIGLCNVIDRKKKLRTLLSAIIEQEEEEKERVERRKRRDEERAARKAAKEK